MSYHYFRRPIHITIHPSSFLPLPHLCCFIFNILDAFELADDTDMPVNPDDDLLSAPGLGGIGGKKLSPPNTTLGGVLAFELFIIIISELIFRFWPGTLPEVRDRW
jgi:hypothetical protein